MPKPTKSSSEGKSILLGAMEKIRAEGFEDGCRHAAKTIMQMAKQYLESLDKPTPAHVDIQQDNTLYQVKVSKRGERYLRMQAIINQKPGLRAEQIVQALIAGGDTTANINAVRTTLSRLKADKTAVSNGGQWYPPVGNEGDAGITLPFGNN